LKEYRELELRRKVYIITEEFFNLLSSSSSDTLFHEITRIIAERMAVPVCYIMLYYKEADRLELESSYGMELQGFKCLTLEIGEGVEGWVAREHSPLIIRDIRKDPRVYKLLGKEGRSGALMSMPLVSKGEFIGVASVLADLPEKFNEEMVQLFSIICSKSAQTLKRGVALRESDRRAREYGIIMKITELNGKAKDLDDLIRLLERNIPKLMGVADCTVDLKEPARRKKERLCRCSTLEKCVALKNGMPLIDYFSRKTVCPGKKGREENPSICIPLRVPDEPLGVMYLDLSPQEPLRRSTPEFYQILSFHISCALFRFMSSRRFEKKLDALSTLYEVANVMSSTANLQDALELILKIVARLLNAERVQIMLLNEEDNELYVRASWSIDGKSFGVPRLKVGQGVAGWVIKHAKPYCIKDTREDPLFVPSPDGQQEIKSFLCVPIMDKNRRRGVINIATITREREFSEDEIKTLTVISNRAALAIENTQLVERIREYIAQLKQTNEQLETGRTQLQNKSRELVSANRQLNDSLQQTQTVNRQLSTLYEVTRTLASTLDLEDILSKALEKIMKLLSSPLGAISILLFNEEKEALEFAATKGIKMQSDRIYDINFCAIPPKIARMLFSRRKPVFLEGTDAIAELEQIELNAGIRSIYIWPLVVKGKTIGVLTVTCGSEKGLRDDEKDLLDAMTTQMSVAIDNARLFQESTKRARELSSIHQIINAIISNSPFQTRLDAMVELAAKLMNQTFCAVALLEGGRYLGLKASYGLRREFIADWHSSALAGIVDDVIKEGQYFCSSEGRQQIVREHPFLKKEGIDSLIVAPLRVQDSVTGILLFGNYEDYQYKDDEKKLLSFLADQVALGIENVTLYVNAILEKNKMGAILNSMGDGVITLNWKKEITSCNEAATLIAGWSEEEMMGKSCPDIFRGKDNHGIEQCSTHCPFIQMLASPEAMMKGIKNKGSIVTKEGVERFIEATHSLLSVGGELQGEVIVFRDVTEEKLLQQMKSDFIASVAHDLRTPLAAIKGYAMTLIKHGGKFDKDTQREFFMIINSEIDRLTRLLENLLNLTKMEVGKLITRPEKFNVLILLKKVRDLYQMNTSKHTIVIENDQSPPYALADVDQVEQILNNLVSNAIKYSPSGGRVVLSVRTEDGFMKISAEDEGIGIPEEERENIFERYHRVDSSSTRRISGTGLGLFITKILVEAQGGTIGLESTLGEGSLFYFTLPLSVGI
jgi:two-component system phosphate regulon sensor histidine kinase PhoR